MCSNISYISCWLKVTDSLWRSKFYWYKTSEIILTPSFIKPGELIFCLFNIDELFFCCFLLFQIFFFHYDDSFQTLIFHFLLFVCLFFPLQTKLPTEPFELRLPSRLGLCQSSAASRLASAAADGGRSTHEDMTNTVLDWISLFSAPLFHLPYLAVKSCGLHAAIALWSPHAELTLVCGTVNHSGWSKDCLHQQQHHQNQQQDVIGLLGHTFTNKHTERNQFVSLQETSSTFSNLASLSLLLTESQGWIGQILKVCRFRFNKFTLAVGTSWRKISIKLITLQDRKPEAEKSRGDVTLLMAISTSTWEMPPKEEGGEKTQDVRIKSFLKSSMKMRQTNRMSI